MVAFQFLRDVKGEPFSLVKIFGVYTYSPLVAFGYMREAPLEAPFEPMSFAWSTSSMTPSWVVANRSVRCSR